MTEQSRVLCKEQIKSLKNSIIFLSSSPYQIKNTGDFDYTVILMEKLNSNGIQAEIISHEISKNQSNQQLYCLAKIGNLIKKINKKEIKNQVEVFQETYKNQFKKNQDRKQFVNNIKNHILITSQKKKKNPILNIQMRVPQTGFLFFPQDLKEFKNLGIQIIVTCHQYKLFSSRRHLQYIYHPFLIEANMVLFFNKNDLKSASKHANKIKIAQIPSEFVQFQPYNLQKKSFLTQVPPTIQYTTQNIDQLMNRPSNIIVFGMIRPSKGFQQAIQIAKYLHTNKQRIMKQLPSHTLPRVIIVGYPSSSCLLEQIINTKFGKKVINAQQINKILNNTNSKQNLQKLRQKIDALTQMHQQQSPIDLYLDVQSSEMPKLFSKSKYAVKFDEKGWANNASSHINALANGLILYTGWGIDTDDDVLPSRTKNSRIVPQGQYYQSIILNSNKYGLTFGQKLTNQQQIGHIEKFEHFRLGKKVYQSNKQNLMTSQWIIDDIIRRQNNADLNKKTFIKARQMFRNKFDPNIIVRKIIQDISNFMF